jgi:His-Xaa-Ser system protein HxsD
MRLMPQAAKLPAASPVEVAVDFDSSIQGLGALDGAAYRLIGIATCRINQVGERYVCHLAPSGNPQKGAALSPEDLKERFLNLVVDENLRTRIAEQTVGVRNVILALAFGSLAATQKDAE